LLWYNHRRRTLFLFDGTRSEKQKLFFGRIHFRRGTMGMTTVSLSYWQAESEGIDLLDLTK
jgi:hypothetical protein